MASNGIKWDTASMSVESFVKSLLNETRNIRISAENTMLMRRLVPFTTITENLASLGCAAPNSLLTLTLQI